MKVGNSLYFFVPILFASIYFISYVSKLVKDTVKVLILYILLITDNKLS